MELRFHPMFLNAPKSVSLFEDSQSCPACPSDNSGIKMEMNASIGGMMLAGETKIYGKETCPIAALSTTDCKRKHLGSKPELCG
jgi:hypothetical protein